MHKRSFPSSFWINEKVELGEHHYSVITVNFP